MTMTIETTNAIRIPLSSTEYLKVWITADVTLSAQTVYMAVIPARGRPTAPDWKPADWTGSPGTTRAAMLFVGAESDNVIAIGDWDVWVKVSDNPEIPTDPAGRLTVY
jgi:hypothetical protein